MGLHTIKQLQVLETRTPQAAQILPAAIDAFPALRSWGGKTSSLRTGGQKIGACKSTEEDVVRRIQALASSQ
jgi:hypothetical protein